MSADDRNTPNEQPDSRSVPRLLGRGAVAGSSFGLAAAIVESGNLTIGKLGIGTGVPSGGLLSACILSVLLGAVLGLVTAPLLRVRRGDLWHLAAVTLLWASLGVAAGLPELPRHLLLAVAPWVAAFPLVLGGRAVARRVPWLPAAAAAVALGAIFAAPVFGSGASGGGELTPPAGGRAAADAPDVLLVVLDTVRADHVGAYGYHRRTTPRLDALATDGVLFERASAPATWSLPSHASLFTGLFPSAHGAHSEHRALADATPTLAERLAGAGYQTRCFTANPWISDGLGLTRGFQWSDEAWRSGEMAHARLYPFRLLDWLGFSAEDKGGAAVADSFERWAATAPPDGPPTFAFVNFVEAHFPHHQLPREYLERFSDVDRATLRRSSLRMAESQFGGAPPPAEARAHVVDMYDAGVAYSDHLLGRLLDALDRRGTLDDTLVVVLSDHGELLGELGAWGHGLSLHPAELHVPLVIRFPARVEAGHRVEAPVSTVAVLATVLDAAGLVVPEGLHGRSLLSAVDAGASPGPVIAERFRGDPSIASAAPDRAVSPLLRADRRFRSYRSGDHVLIRASDDTRHLFVVGLESRELRDVAAAEPSTVARLQEELSAWRVALDLPPIGAESERQASPTMDDETLERLRSLGYVQ